MKHSDHWIMTKWHGERCVHSMAVLLFAKFLHTVHCTIPRPNYETLFRKHCLLNLGNIVAETKFAFQEAKVFPNKLKDILVAKIMFPSLSTSENMRKH